MRPSLPTRANPQLSLQRAARGGQSGPVAAGQPVERVAGHAHDPPVGHHRCAEALVEPDRGRVPVEHRPLEPTAVARPRDRGERVAAAHRRCRRRDARDRRKDPRATARDGRGTSRKCGKTTRIRRERSPAVAISTSAAGGRPEQRPSQIRFASKRKGARASRTRRARGSSRRSPGRRPVAPRGSLNPAVVMRRAAASRRPRITRSRSTPSSSATAGRCPQRWKPAPAKSASDGVLWPKTNASNVLIRNAFACSTACSSRRRAKSPALRSRRRVDRHLDGRVVRRPPVERAQRQPRSRARRTAFRTRPRAAGGRDRTRGTTAPAAGP